MKPHLLFLAALVAAPAAAQENFFQSADTWTTSAEGVWFAEEAGEPVLRMRGGFAALDDLVFRDGTIRFEMKLTPHAGFVGMRFRAADPRNAEHVYFRPHKSGQWDAIQYQPIMNGSSTWQLHHGEGYTQSADLPHARWFSVRLDVHGTRADLYVGDAMVPTMMIGLERGITEGGISFTAGFRGEAPEGEIAGAFRRLVVEPSVAAPPRPMADEPMASDGFIRTWSVSEPFALPDLPATTVPATGAGWTTVDAEPRGLVNLNRHFARVGQGRRSAVVAGVVIDAARAAQVPLHFDFTDDISIFLNDRLLYSGTNSWQARYPFYLATISAEVLVNQVWLPLEAGENRLTVVVSEQAFGWGFVARMDRPDGIEIRAPQ